VLIVWGFDIAAGIKKYAHWQDAGQLFLLSLMLATATAALGLLFYVRGRLANSLDRQPAESLGSLRSLSSGMVSLTMVLLLIVFFVISSR
jgi:hypothetical protein